MNFAIYGTQPRARLVTISIQGAAWHLGQLAAHIGYVARAMFAPRAGRF